MTDGRVRLFLGAAIGVIAAFAVYGTDFLSGDPRIWGSLGGDAGIGLAGFRTFLDEPWTYPLLHVDRLNAPDGIVIVFTDSLSLWALIAKAFRWVGLSANQWFALWYLTIFALQGLAAVAATRAFGVRSWIIESAVAVIAVSAPIMMLRTWHPGLAAQFTLLLAWAVVGHLHVGRREHRAAKQDRVLWWATALAVITLLIHPYLLVGVLAVVGSAALGLVFRDELAPRRFALWVVGSVVPVVVVGVVTGLIGSSVDPAAGFGLYGTYVLGPALPQWSRLWPGNEWILEANGSFEGFNWLGMGWLFLVVAAVVSQPGRVWAHVKEHQVVSAAMVLLSLYAVGPVVRLWSDDPHDVRTPLAWIVQDRSTHRWIYGLGGLVVATLIGWLLTQRRGRVRAHGGFAVMAGVLAGWSVAMLLAPGVIDRITGQLRVSGRLLWPVSYGALVIGAALLSRLPARRLVAPLVVAAALLQVIDVQQFRDQAHDVFVPTDDRVTALNALTEVVDLHENVHLEPDFYCAAEFAGTPGLLRFQDIVVASSRAGTAVDNVYAARQGREPCDKPPVLLAGSDVVNAIIIPEGGGSSIIAPQGQECRTLDLVLLCTENWDLVPPSAAGSFGPR